MTKKEADFIGAMNMCDEISNEAYKKIMCHCEEQEPCDDIMIIHTQGLDEGIRCAMCTNLMRSDMGCDGGCIVNEDMHKEVMNTIRNHIVPPVTPVRKKGKWINILPCTTNFKDQIIYQCVCDRCGSIAYFRRMCGKLVGAKYCPNCGAKMEDEDDRD